MEDTKRSLIALIRVLEDAVLLVETGKDQEMLFTRINELCLLLRDVQTVSSRLEVSIPQDLLLFIDRYKGDTLPYSQWKLERLILAHKRAESTMKAAEQMAHDLQRSDAQF